MTMRHRLLASCLCLCLAPVLDLAAQGDRLTPGGRETAADREIERAVRLLAQRERLSANQERELERVTRMLAQQRGLNGEVEREIDRLARQLGEVARQRTSPRGAAGSSAGQAGAAGARTGGPASPAFDPSTYDPMAGPIVRGAPFSADALTTVTQTLGDGTNIEQTATSKFYRDSAGRVRREQTIVGLELLNPAAQGQPQTVITVDSEPGDPRPYVLDPVARTARRVPRASVSPRGGTRTARVVESTTTVVSSDGERRIVPFRTFVASMEPAAIDQPIEIQGLVIPRRGIPGDLRPTEEMLGTRQIEGVAATGHRTTVIIPTGRVGNDRPIQITDERWASPELGVVVYSRFSDPRTGVVEYRLMNIGRIEPRPDVFTVPADYTIVGEGQPGRRSIGPSPATPTGR